MFIGMHIGIPGDHVRTSFVANDIANAAIDLDAAKGITIATGVSIWADTSTGGGLSVAQAVTSKQPGFTAANAAFGGAPTVDPDGVDDFLQGIWTLNQPEHVFLVGKWNVAFAAADTMIDGGANISMLFDRAGAAQLNQYAGAFVVDTTATPLTPHVHELIYDGASAAVLADGVVKMTGNVGATNAGGLTIGSFATPGTFGNVSIARIVIYRRHLTAAEASVVRRNLGLAYGLPVAA